MIDKDKIKAVALILAERLTRLFCHWMGYLHSSLYDEVESSFDKRKFSRFVCVCGADDGAIATSKARTFPA